MTLCDHALYRSQVYAKPDSASFTYVRMMDLTSYLPKLLANQYLRGGVMKHFHTIKKFLAHPSCEIVQQLKFNLDLIEVSHGVCLSVENRAFVPCPIDDAMRGKISLTAFVPYDCTTRPEPSYFREAILNSFDEPAVHVNFLNKLYQCLMASKMPQKVRNSLSVREILVKPLGQTYFIV